MRATTTPAKRRTRGIASAMIMSAVVGFSILGSGTALAGNTSKQVYFGSGRRFSASRRHLVQPTQPTTACPSRP